MPYANKAQQAEYQAAWIAQRRAEYFTGKSCARCDSTDGLELDHIDPATKVDHKIWSWSKARRDVELAKCEVLCSPHHMEKTLQQRRQAPHGNGQMYQIHGCRCEACCGWKLASSRKYRAAREVRATAS